MTRTNDNRIGSGIICYDLDGRSFTAEEFVLEFEGLIATAIRRTVGLRNSGSYGNEDIVQDAMYRCLQNAGRFDPTFQVKLSVYVYQSAMGHAKRFIRDHSHILHVPRSTKECESRIRRLFSVDEWAEKEKDLEATAEELGFPVKVVREAFLYLREGRMAASFEMPMSSTDEGDIVTLYSLVRAPEVDPNVRYRLELINEYLKEAVNARDRALIVGYIERIPQKDIAELLGYSQMHVSRMQRRAVHRMREALKNKLRE